MSTPGAGKKTHRIPSLDVIRGVAILGVLAVNADGFAAPIHASLRPSAWMFGNEGATALSYWIMDWLFHEKFVAIFSMLFGVSLFLVGGEIFDKERGLNLGRRLAALVFFALIHGFGLWWGDILSTYACAGIIMFAFRSLPPRALLGCGAAILLAAASQALPRQESQPGESPAAVTSAHTVNGAGHPPIGRIEAELAEATASAKGAYSLNARTYVHQLSNLWRLLPQTIAFMMIGLGLFKLRFFSATWSQHAYLAIAGVGLLALTVLSQVTWMHDVRGLHLRWGTFIEDLLSPCAALGYMAALILALRYGLGRWLSPFAYAGRMAFTNYLTQSLIMTSIFYGGRGALMGHVDRPALWAIVVAIWILQLAWSRWWLSRFEMGPLEWLWRWATYGYRTRFVKPVLQSGRT